MTDVTFCCEMYPAGKVDIPRHLAIPGFLQSDHTVGKPSAMVHCVVKHSKPPDLKASSNVSLPFTWITGPATDSSYALKHCSRYRLSVQHVAATLPRFYSNNKWFRLSTYHLQKSTTFQSSTLHLNHVLAPKDMMLMAKIVPKVVGKLAIKMRKSVST